MTLTPVKISLKSNPRPLLPSLLRVQQYQYEVPNSKSSEAMRNVSYPPTCLDRSWLCIHPEGHAEAIFLGSPVVDLYKLLVIQCFLTVIQSDGEELW